MIQGLRGHVGKAKRHTTVKCPPLGSRRLESHRSRTTHPRCSRNQPPASSSRGPCSPKVAAVRVVGPPPAPDAMNRAPQLHTAVLLGRHSRGKLAGFRPVKESAAALCMHVIGEGWSFYAVTRSGSGSRKGAHSRSCVLLGAARARTPRGCFRWAVHIGTTRLHLHTYKILDKLRQISPNPLQQSQVPAARSLLSDVRVLQVVSMAFQVHSIAYLALCERTHGRSSCIGRARLDCIVLKLSPKPHAHVVEQLLRAANVLNVCKGVTKMNSCKARGARFDRSGPDCSKRYAKGQNAPEVRPVSIPFSAAASEVAVQVCSQTRCVAALGSRVACQLPTRGVCIAAERRDIEC